MPESKAQVRLMQAILHNAEFKGKGKPPPKSVAKEIVKKAKGKYSKLPERKRKKET